MRNLQGWSAAALRLRLCLHPVRGKTLAQRVSHAVSSYAPVGYCAGVSSHGAQPQFVWGGEAVVGERAVQRDTVFRVASVSKMLGAAAVLHLARAGRLDLDGDVGEILGFPIRPAITPRQLLTHTAALCDGAYNLAAEAGDFPPLDVLLEKSRCAYPPGTHFAYSNLGAGVAGMLVEAVAGVTFDEYIRGAFFRPLGVDASFHPQHIERKEQLANCYRVPGRTLSYDAQKIAAQPLDEAPDPLRHYYIPAGKLMISAPALVEVLGGLVRRFPEMYARQDHIGSVRCDARRGLGMAFAGDVFRRGMTFVGHQGQAYGAVCEAWANSQDSTVAVFLSNGSALKTTGALQRIGQDAIAALFSWAYEGEKQ